MLFDKADIAELRQMDFPGNSLIARLNQLLREERRHKIEELLQATVALLDPFVAVSRRPRRPLRKSLRIMQNAALREQGTAKHLDLEVEEQQFAAGT